MTETALGGAFDDLGGAFDDLVVDIGDIAPASDGFAAEFVAQQPRQPVEDDERAGIADMDPAVDGRPADIRRTRSGSIGANGSLRRVNVL